eukprot:Nk52_evm1s1976 gene=Nk52_evmTU1s1976
MNGRLGALEEGWQTWSMPGSRATTPMPETSNGSEARRPIKKEDDAEGPSSSGPPNPPNPRSPFAPITGRAEGSTSNSTESQGNTGSDWDFTWACEMLQSLPISRNMPIVIDNDATEG